MIKRAVYEDIRSLLFSREPQAFEIARARYPGVSHDTLVSIHAQECSKQLRIGHHQFREPRRISQYIKRYLAGASMLAVSEEFQLPPCLVARILLEHMLGLRKVQIRNALKEPGQLQAMLSLPEGEDHVPVVGGPAPLGGAAAPSAPSATAAAPPPAPPCVSVSRLSRDLALCIENDTVSSPLVENVRRVVGLEFEALLCETLRNHGLTFQSEDDLRAVGHAKTPDVLLQVPMAVRGRVVHWIDSKASFGDESTHVLNLEEQFQRYVNRFGPGMVIYWFGFVEELDTHADILLVDDFPAEDEIFRLPVLPVKPRQWASYAQGGAEAPVPGGS